MINPGTRIRELRPIAGMPQKELGRKVGVPRFQSWPEEDHWLCRIY